VILVVGRDVRQLITHTMSDVFTHSRKPTRDNIRATVRKVSRSPTSFADYINGCIFDDGVNSLMLMLESKEENLNRRVLPAKRKSVNDPGPSSSQKPKRVSKTVMMYGCKCWEVAPSTGETVETMERNQLRLQVMYSAKTSGSSLEMQELMHHTFSCQRYAINSQLPISDVLEEWPYLGIRSCLLQHCSELMDIDIETLLLSAVEKKAIPVYEFCKRSRGNSKVSKVLHDIETEASAAGRSSQAIRSGVILLVMASLHDDICKSDVKYNLASPL